MVNKCNKLCAIFQLSKNCTESLQNVRLTSHSCVQWCGLYSLSTAQFGGHTAPHGRYKYKAGSWESPSVLGDNDHTDAHKLREYIHTDRWPHGRMNALNLVDRTHMLEKRNKFTSCQLLLLLEKRIKFCRQIKTETHVCSPVVRRGK